jgi:hypothetical protein
MLTSPRSALHRGRRTFRSAPHTDGIGQAARARMRLTVRPQATGAEAMRHCDVPRLTAQPALVPKRWFWVTNAAVAVLEFYAIADLVIRALLRHVDHGPLLAALVLGVIVVAAAHRVVQVQPRRWAWRVCIGIQATLATALVLRAFTRPVALLLLVVPGVGLGVLASETARRYYLHAEPR